MILWEINACASHADTPLKTPKIHITEIQWVASGFFPPQEQLENEGFSCLMLTFILQYQLWLLIDGSHSHVFILSIF